MKAPAKTEDLIQSVLTGNKCTFYASVSREMCFLWNTPSGLDTSVSDYDCSDPWKIDIPYFLPPLGSYEMFEHVSWDGCWVPTGDFNKYPIVVFSQAQRYHLMPTKADVIMRTDAKLALLTVTSSETISSSLASQCSHCSYKTETTTTLSKPACQLASALLFSWESRPPAWS